MKKINMKEYKVSISQNYSFTIEDINDIVVGALEGGINYWCEKAEIVYTDKDYKGVAVEDRDKIQYASDVIGYGGELELTDMEDPNEKWILNIDKMLKGIQMYCERNDVALSDIMDIQDAEVCDQIVQYGLFNELVFG